MQINNSEQQTQPQSHQVYTEETFPKDQIVQKTEVYHNSKCVNVNVDLDQEAFNILQKANPLYSETIINAGIKLISRTPLYKEIMSSAKKETPVDDINDAVSLSIKDTLNTTPTPSKSTTQQGSSVESLTKAKSGFNAWS